MDLPKKDKNYLSFLFSDTDLKIGKIEATKGKKSLALFFESPLPPGIIVEGEVKDAEKLSKFITELKQKFALKEEPLIVGLPENKTTVHTLELPKLSFSEINQAIKYQADSFLPFPYENEYVDWRVVEGKPDGNGKIKVIVSAIPKSVIDGYILSFSKASLQPVALESTSISLLRMIPRPERHLCLATEFGSQLTIVVVGPEGNIETSSVVKEKGEYLPTIQKIIDYYFKDKVLPPAKLRIFLSGKEGGEFSEKLKGLGLEVIPAKTGISGIPQGREPELAVLLSLAQKKVALPEDEKTINILPQTLVDQYKKAAEESQERKVNLLAVIILLLLDFVVLLTFFQTKLRIDSLSKDSLLKENSAKISSLENHRQDIILVNQIFLQNDLFRKVVTGFWQAKDQPVILSGLSFSETKGEIFFSGKANSRQDLLTFKDNLEKSDLFAKVSIPFSSLGEESNVDFKIILKLK
jgi:hypothetical protein